MKINKKIAEKIGWCGTIAIILAYMSVSFGIISVDNLVFQLLNLIGALGLIAVSHLKRVPQVVSLNVFWAIIAVFGIVRILLHV